MLNNRRSFSPFQIQTNELSPGISPIEHCSWPNRSPDYHHTQHLQVPVSPTNRPRCNDNNAGIPLANAQSKHLNDAISVATILDEIGLYNLVDIFYEQEVSQMFLGVRVVVELEPFLQCRLI